MKKLIMPLKAPSTKQKPKIAPLDQTLQNSRIKLIMQQIPNDPRKTKQLASFLNLAEGERTEIAIIVRTDDGML